MSKFISRVVRIVDESGAALTGADGQAAKRPLRVDATGAFCVRYRGQDRRVEYINPTTAKLTSVVTTSSHVAKKDEVVATPKAAPKGKGKGKAKSAPAAKAATPKGADEEAAFVASWLGVGVEQARKLRELKLGGK